MAQPNVNIQVYGPNNDVTKTYKTYMLKTNRSVSEQMVDEDTIYEVKFDFDLDGDTVTIPANCILDFQGGSINNGTLVGQDTVIKAGMVKIFDSLLLDGTWNIDGLHSLWYGDNGQSYTLNNDVMANYIIPSLEDITVPLIIDKDFYYTTPLVFSGSYDIICNGYFMYNGDKVAKAVTVGVAGSAQRLRNFVFKVRQVSIANYINGEVPENYGLYLINLIESNIKIEHVLGFAYATCLIGINSGFAYNTIYLNEFARHHYTGLTLTSTGTGYCNENVFIGGMLHVESNSYFKNDNIGISIGGSEGGNYSTNCNVFIRPCIEGSVVGVVFHDMAERNNLLYVRDEAVTTRVQSDSTCSNNTYLSSYSTAENSDIAGFIGTSIVDAFTNTHMSDTVLYDSDIKVFTGNTCRTGNIPLTSISRNEYNTSTLAKGNALTSFYAGFKVDTSTVKTLFVTSDIKCRFMVRMYDSNNDIITIDSTTIGNYVTSTLSLTVSFDMQGTTGADKKYMAMEFSNDVKRVFVGVRADQSGHIRISTNYRTPGIETTPQENKVLYEVPTEVEGTLHIGECMFYNDKPIYWNGTAWVDATGATV